MSAFYFFRLKFKIWENTLFKNLLGSIDALGLWSIISMSIFFVVFIGIIIYTYKLNKNQIEYMARIPLSENENLRFIGDE